MKTVLDLQKRLLADGFAPGKPDGLIGPATIGAVFAALDALATKRGKAPVPPAEAVAGLVPVEWMPFCKMDRVIVHWTAGANTASKTDRDHYHLLIEGDGKVVRGVPPITANAAPVKPGYAAHTLNCNTGSIGISLCGMAGAKEAPFSAGKSPITETQWETLKTVVAEVCARYAIPVTPGTVLSHAEVQTTLGIAQRGKWDIARLPFPPNVSGAREIGNRLRYSVSSILGRKAA